jgi:hypothetical protein
MRTVTAVAALLGLLSSGSPALAELASVTIQSRAPVAGGQAFGATGTYEKLRGTIEFALDPRDPHNAGIVDLERAPRASDGRVHFTADLYVLRPVDASKGNGVLLFEVANRGRKLLLGRFNSAPPSADPSSVSDFGNGFLMREGYTIVWIGWEFDVEPPLLHLNAPLVPGVTGSITVPVVPNVATGEVALTDVPLYPPEDRRDGSATLTVRNRFPDRPVTIPREQWRFASDPGVPRIILDGGFAPGRIYQVTYVATGARVVGAGLAAIRDAASAFRYRSDLPIRGSRAYAFGLSQDGRFLREFLYDGFNVDEHDRRVFDAVWSHIAGAARGSFNERFGRPTALESFSATRFPFSNAPETYGALRGGLLDRYRPDQRPKVFYSNTSVEYWGQGRAAALIHTSPADERIYFLAGTQHIEATFPPTPGLGQQLPNPVPQQEVMRALLKDLHDWVSRGTPPPESRYPRLGDGTLTPVQSLRFPAIPGIPDPRTITGPVLVTTTGSTSLPFLVPQVDADGNDIAGIRVPDVSVPVATNTGWNFRSPAVGNPGDIVPLLGSYIPFAATEAERAPSDPRPSIEARYHTREEYLRRLREAANDLVRQRYLLEEDVSRVMRRGEAQWHALVGDSPAVVAAPSR